VYTTYNTAELPYLLKFSGYVHAYIIWYVNTALYVYVCVAFYYVAFARPNIKEILLHIEPHSFDRWFDIGILLDVPVQKLRDIKFSDNTQSDICCKRMFTEWLDSDVNPTWSTLSLAISSCTNNVELNDYCGKG